MIDDITNIVDSSIRISTPILFALLGEMITEKSGKINLGIEGIMLSGAFVGVVINYHTTSLFLAFVSALSIGIVLGSVFAMGVIKFKANQIAFGLALTIFCTGVTSFLGIEYIEVQISNLEKLNVYMISDLPIIGPLFSQDILVYIGLLAVLILYIVFNKTFIGLKIVATGEAPEAAYKANINVSKIQSLCCAVGGGLMAVGGCYLAIEFAQGWVENMTLGRGFIAAGLVIFSYWRPQRAILAVLVFGMPTAFQLNLQANGSTISPFLLSMIPYIAVILALIWSGFGKNNFNSKAPGALSN